MVLIPEAAGREESGCNALSITDIATDSQRLREIGVGSGTLTAGRVGFTQIMRGSGLAMSVASLAVKRKRLLLSGKRGSEITAIADDRGDVVEGVGDLAGIAELAPDRQRFFQFLPGEGRVGNAEIHRADIVEQRLRKADPRTMTARIAIHPGDASLVTDPYPRVWPGA